MSQHLRTSYWCDPAVWCVAFGSHSFASSCKSAHYGNCASVIKDVIKISPRLTWLCCLSLNLSLSLSHQSLSDKTTESNENVTHGCRGLLLSSIATLFVFVQFQIILTLSLASSEEVASQEIRQLLRLIGNGQYS